MKSLLSFLVLLFFLNAPGQMLSSVYFEVNSDRLSAESIRTLDSLASLKSPLVFRIFGNTDITGSSAFNNTLSDKRAITVTEYLSSRISSNIKIGSSQGLGESKQINNNSTDELKALNRRTDIYIEKQFLPNEKIDRKPPPDFLMTDFSKMKAGQSFQLDGVNFYGGRHKWLPNSEIKLLRLADILKSNPSLKIEIHGFICCDYISFDGLDTDLRTFNLSFTRADAVRNFLVSFGVEPDRIKAVGKGHLNPIVYPEITNEDRSKNRRVEIFIVEK